MHLHLSSVVVNIRFNLPKLDKTYLIQRESHIKNPINSTSFQYGTISNAKNKNVKLGMYFSSSH